MAGRFFMARFTGATHAVLRITTALTFLSHGTMKLFAFPPLVAMPGQPPMPQPDLLSPIGFTAILELVGGLLVMIGLWTRPVAFVLAGEMAVAYWLVHVPSGGFFPVDNFGEPAYLFCFVFLWLSAAGAGPASLDERRAFRATGDAPDGPS